MPEFGTPGGHPSELSLTRHSDANHFAVSDGAAGKNVIRIMAASDCNKLKFVLTNTNNKVVAPQPTVNESAVARSDPLEPSSVLARPAQKRPSGKRKAVEGSDMGSSCGDHKGPGQRSAKKGKYERKSLRPIENGILSWAGLKYQPNALFLQSSLSKQFPDTSPVAIQALASAYAFEDNLGFARSHMRKEYTAQMLRKALGRAQFGQTQSFQNVSYRPGGAFVHHMNTLGRSSAVPKSKAVPPPVLAPNTSTATAGESGPEKKAAAMPPQTEVANTASAAAEFSDGHFVCQDCRRPEAKKYAKNLCQTCYKKRKKLADSRGDDTVPKGADLDPSLVPPPPSGIHSDGESRGWTGTCVICKR